MKISQSTLQNLYESNRRYIATYNSILVIDYSTPSKMFGCREIYSPIIKNSKHFSKKGKWDSYDEQGINNLLGFQLLNS